MGKIAIIGVGFARGQLTQSAEEALLGAEEIILHTDRCACAEWLDEKNLPFRSLDEFYEEIEDFDEHATAVAQQVIHAAEKRHVVYGVLDVRDRSVGEILRRVPAQVIPGPPVEDALFAQAEGATLFLEASDWESFQLHAAQNTLVRELDSRALASEVKLKLMDCYPEEWRVCVRLPEGGIAETELYNLDRMKKYDHRTAVFVPACTDWNQLERFGFEELERIVRHLRAPGGCPWDRQQTHASLRADLIEEAYEVAQAIDTDDEAGLIEELGDLLFGVALHAEIARAHGEFEMRDITSGIVEKMIRRHPHLFSGAKQPEKAQISEQWHEIKRKEHGFSGREEAMRAVARALPALVRAEKVLGCMEDEQALAHLAKQNESADTCSVESIGAELLRTVARALMAEIDPEQSLAKATDEFINQYAAMKGN